MKGHVRKRRTWEFMVDVGPHPVTGGRRQKSKSGFAQKRKRKAPCTSSFVTSTEEAIRVRSESGSPRTWIGGSSTNALEVSALVPWKSTKATFAERSCRRSAA